MNLKPAQTIQDALKVIQGKISDATKQKKITFKDTIAIRDELLSLEADTNKLQDSLDKAKLMNEVSMTKKSLNRLVICMD